MLALLVAATLIRTVPLEGTTYHVQGIAVDGARLWVTSVDTSASKAWLFEYDIDTGKRRRAVEMTDGARFHPGGLDEDIDSLWLPVAEYRAASSAIIEQRSKETLEVISRFEVGDHVGAVAVCGDQIIGANWDARTLYTWSRDGKLLAKRANPHETRYQDLKCDAGALVGSGTFPKPRAGGVVEWMDPETLDVLDAVHLGQTDRGRAYNAEGMAIRDGRLYLLPEDGQSRLFIFDLNQ